jgi:hypothetical protein
VKAILAWHGEVIQRGGNGAAFYRAAYKEGDAAAESAPPENPWEGLLQGGGKSGGLGLDEEFIENAILPTVMVHGFLGVRPSAPRELIVRPRIPAEVPFLGIEGLRYRGSTLRLKAGKDWIDLTGSEIETAAGTRVSLVFETEATENVHVLKDGEKYEGGIRRESGRMVVFDDLQAARYEIAPGEAEGP